MSLAYDMLDSWEVFLMAATSRSTTDENKQACDIFDCRWDFLGVFLPHSHYEDVEQILRDCMMLVRGLNQ